MQPVLAMLLLALTACEQPATAPASWRKWLKALAAAPLSAKVGLLIVALYVIVALFAPLISPYGEAEIVGPQFEPWGGEFLLGTDNLGRDMLSRLIYGARNTVGIAFASTLIAFALGGTLGVFSAVAGGWPDQLLSRLVDVLMAIPQLIFALLILSVVGTTATSLVLVIALLDATRVFRLARAVAMTVVVQDFVEAARLRGEGLWWLVSREVLPNAAAPLIAEFGLRFCFVFLFISALSFLGLGIQPPAADWGSLVRENIESLSSGSMAVVAPALAIASLTIAANLLIDNLPGRNRFGD